MPLDGQPARVTLVIGPERLKVQSALGVLLGDAARRAPVLVVGGPPRDPATAPAFDRLPAGARPAEVREWLDRSGGAVVVDGAGAIGGGLLGERAEDRIRRFVAEVAPQPSERLFVIEPFAVADLSDPDAEAARLLRAGVEVRTWDGSRLGELPPAQGPRDRLAFALAALAVSALVAIAAVRPGLVGEPGTLIGDLEQGLPRSLWLNWWVDRQVAAGQPVGWTDALYWPAGLHVVSYFRNLGAAALSLPFQWAFGFPGYWLPFVGCAVVCNGLAAAWMARRVGADRPGALVAAALFAGAPALLREVGAGAQDLFWAAPLPLAIGLGVGALEGQRRQAILTGLALGLASLIWWFYGVFAALTIAAMAIHRLIRLPQQRAAYVNQIGWMIRAFLPATVALLPLMAEANRRPDQQLGWMRVPGADGELHRAILYLETIATRSLPLDHLIAAPRAELGWVVSVAGLGLVAVGLLWRAPMGRFWGGVAAISALLALGPALDPAWGVSDSWTPLPLGLLQGALPPLRAMDAPGRWMVLGELALAMVAAGALRSLGPRLGRALRRPVQAGALLAALLAPLIGGLLPLDTWRWQAPPWAGVIEQDGVVVHVPMGWSEAPMLWQIAHGNPITGGPDEPVAVADRTEYRRLLEDWPPLGFFWSIERGSLDARGLTELRAKGVRYVVVHQAAIDTLAERLGDDRSWQLPLVADRVRTLLGPPIYSEGGVEVYRLPETLTAS